MAATPKKYKYSWPIEATLNVIGGKWKPLVIYQLKDGTLRFSQIVNRVEPRITQMMLTKQARELEKDGLVIREHVPAGSAESGDIRSRKQDNLSSRLWTSPYWDPNTWGMTSSSNAKNRSFIISEKTPQITVFLPKYAFKTALFRPLEKRPLSRLRWPISF